MASKNSISVSIRIRPSHKGALNVAKNGQSVHCKGTNQNFAYMCDIITGSDQVYAFDKLCGDLLNKLDQGYSCTLLAYGQTGSGKTHTMFGAPGCLSEASLNKNPDPPSSSTAR